MAKTSRKSKARVTRTGKARRDGKSSATAQAVHAHAEDGIDGCDVEFLDSDATPDAELPAARGGVKILRGKRQRSPHVHEDDHVDGCDVEFLESEATPDAALPAAIGGVAGGNRRRRPAQRI